MSLPGKILLIIGITYIFVGLFMKIFTVDVDIFDGASLILIGILTAIFAVGNFEQKKVKQSKKVKFLIGYALYFFSLAAFYLF